MTLRELIENHEKETEEDALRYFEENGFTPEAEFDFEKRELLSLLGAAFRVYVSMPLTILFAAFVVVGIIGLLLDLISLMIN